MYESILDKYRYTWMTEKTLNFHRNTGYLRKSNLTHKFSSRNRVINWFKRVWLVILRDMYSHSPFWFWFGFQQNKLVYKVLHKGLIRKILLKTRTDFPRRQGRDDNRYMSWGCTRNHTSATDTRTDVQWHSVYGYLRDSVPSLHEFWCRDQWSTGPGSTWTLP